MDAIEAVVALTRERDELAEDLDVYESWFESLVGQTVTLRVTTKNMKRTRFVECVVGEFTSGQGWVLTSLEPEDDPDVYHVSFEDFVKGRVHVEKN
jgi:hypothetical protein